jgi:hypothetical protein
MELSEFAIGKEFRCSGKTYRCTDLGTRVVVAIQVEPIQRTSFDTKTRITTTETISREQADADGWLDGPTYIVAETVFDEDDQEVCEPVDSDSAGSAIE